MYVATPMEYDAKNSFGPVRILWAGLTLAFITCVFSSAYAQDLANVDVRAEIKDLSKSFSVPTAPNLPLLDSAGGITRSAPEFEGERRLNATIVEQIFARYTNYTVRLQSSSGAEQSVDVAAPPGGLQLEMRDMSGDNIPNDLVLTPALLPRTPIVLLNDGNDKFTVAISSSIPGSVEAGEAEASREHQPRDTAALVSPSSRAGGHPNPKRLFVPQLQEKLSSIPAQTATGRLAYTSHPGRAPPVLAPRL